MKKDSIYDLIKPIWMTNVTLENNKSCILNSELKSFIRKQIFLLILIVCVTISFCQKAVDRNLAVDKTLSFDLLLDQSEDFLANYQLDSAEILVEYVLEQLQKDENLENTIRAYVIIGKLRFINVAKKSGSEYFERAISLSGKTSHDTLVASLYQELGRFISNQDGYQSSLIYFEKALKLFRKHKVELKILQVLNNMAWVFGEQGKYDKAVEYHIEALRLAEKNNDIISIIDTYHDLGYCYLQTNNLEEVKKLFTKSEQLALSLNNKEKLSLAYADMGMYLAAVNDYENALKYDLKDLALKQESGVINDLPVIYNNIGFNYLYLKNYTKAQTYFSKALDLQVGYRDKYNKTLAFSGLGAVSEYRKNYIAAEKHFTEALKLAREISNNDRILEGLGNLYRLYKISGEPEKAITVNEQFVTLKDSVFNIQKAKQIDELRTLYETEKKEKEIVFLEQKNKVQKLQRNILIAGMMLMTISAIFIFYMIRQKHRQITLAKEQEKKLLENKLEHKKKELTSYALHLAQKNELLNTINSNIANSTSSLPPNSQNAIHNIKYLVKQGIDTDRDWENFKNRFNDVHKDFNSHLKNEFPHLTMNELRFSCLIKMNLETKEIASILNISPDSVKKARQRLRKKFGLHNNEKLQEFLIRY